jgi:DNA-binding helix-hairpin-helix protein with protein kinase domain
MHNAPLIAPQAIPSSMRFYDPHGAPVELEDSSFAAGGEAAIHRITRRRDLVAKIYHPGKAPPKRKLDLMLANPPADPTVSVGHTSIAWPTSILQDKKGVPVGYTMKCISGATTLFSVYNTSARKSVSPHFGWNYLHRTALNLASALTAIHAKGYIVGDLNESNVLVQLHGHACFVTIIDTASFQIPNPNGPLFLCEVGRPEYTPPELQTRDFSQVKRLEVHDIFSLAVLVYQLLMAGVHPFAGQGEPPDLGERIWRGYFPHSIGKGVKVKPPPTCPSFGCLSPSLRESFLRAFDARTFRPAQRPPASEWMRALRDAESGLSVCNANASHYYHRSYGRCHWCERELQFPGLHEFPSVHRHTRPATRRRTTGHVATTMAAPRVPPAPARHQGVQAPPAQPPVGQGRPKRRRIVTTVGVGAGLTLLVIYFVIQSRTKNREPVSTPISDPQAESPRVQTRRPPQEEPHNETPDALTALRTVPFTLIPQTRESFSKYAVFSRSGDVMCVKGADDLRVSLPPGEYGYAFMDDNGVWFEKWISGFSVMC